MNELDWLRSAAGSPQSPPSIDVTADVMRTLREQRAPQSSMTPMLLGIALASWGLAIASVIVAQQAVSALQDPLAVLLRF